MPQLIDQPARITAAGNKPKVIEEFVGRASSGHDQLSVARMKSPGGWAEPPQRPEFQEISLVLAGCLRVEHEGGVLEVRAGQAVLCQPGEWVRYSTPEPDGARVRGDLPPRLLAHHRPPRSGRQPVAGHVGRLRGTLIIDTTITSTSDAGSGTFAPPPSDAPPDCASPKCDTHTS